MTFRIEANHDDGHLQGRFRCGGRLLGPTWPGAQLRRLSQRIQSEYGITGHLVENLGKIEFLPDMPVDFCGNPASSKPLKRSAVFRPVACVMIRPEKAGQTEGRHRHCSRHRCGIRFNALVYPLLYSLFVRHTMEWYASRWGGGTSGIFPVNSCRQTSAVPEHQAGNSLRKPYVSREMSIQSRA